MPLVRDSYSGSTLAFQAGGTGSIPVSRSSGDGGQASWRQGFGSPYPLQKYMNIFLIIIAILAGYFFIVFFVLRLVVPLMGFGGKFVFPGQLPNNIKQAVSSLEQASAGPEQYLRNVYGLIMEKTLRQWKHGRLKAGTYLHRLFVKNAEEMWSANKFLYCQGINYLSFLLLAGSRFFSTDDIRVKTVFLNFVPHQYLQVRLQGQWVDFDPAGAGIRGQGLGRHAEWFG